MPRKKVDPQKGPMDSIFVRLTKAMKQELLEVVTKKHNMEMNEFMVRAARKEINRLKKVDAVI